MYVYIYNYYKLSKMLNDKVSKWCKKEKLSFSIFLGLKLLVVQLQNLQQFVGRFKEYKK
jgi:hypothetical protein